MAARRSYPLPAEPPAPPRRIQAPLALADRAALTRLAEQDPGSPLALQWQDKIRRFAALAGHNLRSVARQRFGGEADGQLEWMADYLLATAPHHPGRGLAPMDPAGLNAAAWCVRALTRDPGGRADRVAAAQDALARRLAAGDRVEPPPSLGPSFAFDPSPWPGEAAACGRVVLFAPSPYSLLGIALLDLCLRHDVTVTAIVLRRFSARRVAEEWRRDGTRLLRKIWRKLVLRSDENAAVADFSLKSVVARLAPGASDLRALARAHGIDVVHADRFDRPVPGLGDAALDIGLFAGGGRVGPAMLGRFARGIVNVHLGLLPQYRGMDVVEAPILEGRRTVGATAHLMVDAIDAGPVLAKVAVETAAHDNLGALRNTLGGLAPLLLFDAACGLASGRLVPIDQPETGRLHCILHPRMKAMADQALRAAPGDPAARRPLADSLSRCLAALPGRGGGA